jgi:Tfp pilus assembly protein PilP
MSPLWLAALPVLLAGLVMSATMALEHPDEVQATRTWIAQARPSSTLPLPAAALSDATTEDSLPGEDSELPDPFQLGALAPASPTRPAASRVRAQDEEDEENSPVPAASSIAPLPTPVLRLLGTLRRDQEWIAIAELEGSTRQLQTGDTLPGGLGRVLAVREDALDIGQDDAARQTIAMAALPAASPMALAPARKVPARTSQRNTRRRLIRPGMSP